MLINTWRKLATKSTVENGESCWNGQPRSVLHALRTSKPFMLKWMKSEDLPSNQKPALQQCKELLMLMPRQTMQNGTAKPCTQCQFNTKLTGFKLLLTLLRKVSLSSTKWKECSQKVPWRIWKFQDFPKVWLKKLEQVSRCSSKLRVFSNNLQVVMLLVVMLLVVPQLFKKLNSWTLRKT